MALLVFCLGCPQEFTAVPVGTPWISHTIDDSLSGADGVKLGDANHDGLTDLVVGWEESGVVVVYLNPGPEQAAEPWPSVVVGQVADVEDAVFVDLDDDGAMDVVSCCEGSVQTMFVHWAPRAVAELTEPDAWQTQPLPATANQRQWMFCEPAQIDGLNGVDLVAGAKGDDGQIGYLAAPENPRDLAAWSWHPLSAARWVMSIIPRDLDADGDLDIVYSDRKGDERGVYWFESPVNDDLTLPIWRRHAIGDSTYEVMFVDIDWDADAERFNAVAAVAAREVLLLAAFDNPRWPWSDTPIRWSGDFGTAKAVRWGDVDLDGTPDIVFTCENAGGRSGVAWLAQREPELGRRWEIHPISDTAGSKFDLVQLLDVDNDGDLDALTTEESADLGVIWYENPTVAPAAGS